MLVPVDGGVVNGADAVRVVRGREVLPAEVGDGEGRRHHRRNGGLGVWRGRGRGRDEERVERGRVWRDEREEEREMEER